MFIELDRDYLAEEVEQERPPRPGTRFRPWLAALVVTVLLSTLGSAGGVPPPRVAHVADVKIGADGEFTTIGGLILVLEPEAITAVDPSTGTRQWRVETDFDHSSVIAR